LGLKKSGAKKSLVQSILTATDKHKLQSVKQTVASYLGAPHKGRGTMHGFYKSTFSAVDKANQNTFMNSFPGRCRNEVGRLIYGIAQIPMNNLLCILDFFYDGKVDREGVRASICMHLMSSEDVSLV
jgi:hypothetical protein